MLVGLLCTALFGQVEVKRSGGWLESAFVEWGLYDGADMYNVYYKESSASEWVKTDKQLVRNYGEYGRADVVGIKAGIYDLKVVATAGGEEIAASATTIENIGVEAHDRSGFAFMNGKVPGAYNMDGTLKANTKVIYVNSKNFDTVELEVNSNDKGSKIKFVGLQNILRENGVWKYQQYNNKMPICVRVIGEINTSSFPSSSWGSKDEGLSIKCNTKGKEMNFTLEGIGEDATFNGVGILVRSSTSVEIRNIAILNDIDDNLSLDTDNLYTWVHNCDLFYGMAGGDADQAKGDGSLDVKGDSKYQTYSYNHFWDSGKCSLCGMSSETGPNYITYHHNWFDHSDSRHPRVRTMTVHVYNNYYDGVSKYGIGATTGSSVFVEANYFRNTNRPMMSSLQGTDASGAKGTFSGEDGGMIKAYGNIYAECGKNFSYITANSVEGSAATAVNATSFDAYEAKSRDEKVPESYVAKSGGTKYNNFDTDATLMPSYTADKAEDVPAKVMKYAGRVNGGDLKYTFNNAVDDALYAVNSAIKNLLTSYKTTLVAVSAFGDNISGEEEGEETSGGEGGDAPGTGETGTDGEQEYALYVNADGTKYTSDGFYTLTSTNTSKQSNTYNGTTYAYAIKLESSTVISFTPTVKSKLVIILTGATTVKLNDAETAKATADADNKGLYKLELDVDAKANTIKKRDTNNIVYMYLIPNDTATGIETIGRGKEAINVEYYSLTGVRSDKAGKGINIMKTYYTDGSSDCKKIVKK